MSSLVRRMQRTARRSERAKKAAIGRHFATQLGNSNPKAKDLLARQTRHRVPTTPKRLRRSKSSQAWLDRRAEARKAEA